jgi:hypothetical protein
VEFVGLVRCASCGGGGGGISNAVGYLMCAENKKLLQPALDIKSCWYSVSSLHYQYVSRLRTADWVTGVGILAVEHYALHHRDFACRCRLYRIIFIIFDVFSDVFLYSFIES